MSIVIPSLVALLSAPIAAWAAQSARPSDTDRSAVVEGDNAFAIDLYGHLRGQDGNLFFSPESISTALAMTYAGARGDTAAEMAKALHFSLPQDRLHPAMGALLTDLNAAHANYQLRVANALWGQQGDEFVDSFLKLTKKDYGAGFNPVDFKTSAEVARKTINDWVAQKTEDKIKDLIGPRVLDRSTRLVLTNAVYFNGNWETQFDKSRTRDEDFHVTATQVVQAPLMHREGGLNYFDGGSFQALEIPYKSEELSLIVLLPNDVGGLAALEQSMTAASARDWLSKLKPAHKVVLSLPRFKMTQQFGLSDALTAMGMRKAFDKDAADFTGIEARRGLFLSAVIHKAFVDVNEVGTEAAAATAVVVGRAMAIQRPQPPIVFRADHPFVFLIRDNRSGGILFMGRVVNPAN